VSRSISPTLPRCLTTPLGRVQSFMTPNGPGSWRSPSSLAKKYSRSGGKSMPRQGDRTANARWQPRFRMLSSNETAPEVDQVMHTEALGDFPQLRATGREETSQQPVTAKLLDFDSSSVEAVFLACRQKSTLPSIEPPNIDGMALQCACFFAFHRQEASMQCVSVLPRGVHAMRVRSATGV
jgi:hypothetical protein